MLLLTIILLSSCSKLNFPKERKFYSSLKPENEDDVKRNVNYVISGKKDKDEKEEEPKQNLPRISDIQVGYSEEKTLLEIQDEEQKAYLKELKNQERQSNVSVDYSGATKLMDLMKKEQEAREKLEKEEKRLEEDRKKASSSSYNEDSSFQFGYEKTIGGSENDLFC